MLQRRLECSDIDRSESLPTHLAAKPQAREVVRTVKAELLQLTRQHEDIVKRIGSVRRTLCGLTILFGEIAIEPEVSQMAKRHSWRGFTNTCRLILMSAESPLTAREVCAQVKHRFAQLETRHKDPLASVITVLSRLARYGEVKYEDRQNGSRVWQWNY
jgi:hypothetical protein